MFLDHPKEFRGQKTNILGILEAGIQWSFFLTIISVGPCVVHSLIINLSISFRPVSVRDQKEIKFCYR